MKEKVTGRFLELLSRNNSEIREDRAKALYEQSKIIYKRYIEDLDFKIKDLENELENSLDLSPKDSTSLELVKNFDAKGFVDNDAETNMRIKILKIKKDSCVERYNYLYGEKNE
jgi:hypothetical protein